MSYLQLAENDPYSYLAQDIPTSALDMYIFVPQGYRGSTKDMYIREDMLDSMPKAAYSQMMYELEPYQPQGLSGKRGDARRAARDARKEKRAAAKETRSQRRADMFGKLTDTASGLLQKFTGGGSDVPTKGFEGSIEFGAPTEESTMSKYKIPLIIGGVAVAGFLVYKLTKKK